MVDVVPSHDLTSTAVTCFKGSQEYESLACEPKLRVLPRIYPKRQMRFPTQTINSIERLKNTPPAGGRYSELPTITC